MVAMKLRPEAIDEKPEMKMPIAASVTLPRLKVVDSGA